MGTVSAIPAPDEQDDPLARVRRATEQMDWHRQEIGRLAVDRAEALLELRARTGSVRHLAGLLGVTREHAYRLLREAAERSGDRSL
jgi:hypothetical protein